MKLPKPKNKKRALIVLVIVALAIAGLVYLWLRNTTTANNASPAAQQEKTRKVNDVDYSPPTDEDKKQQDQQKEEIIQDAVQGPTNPANMSVSISRASQGGAGQPLVIRAIISGTSSGTCEITLSKDGQPPVIKSFAIAADATYGMCADAQVAAGDFPVGGAWSLKVVAKSGSALSQAATQNVTITK